VRIEGRSVISGDLIVRESTCWGLCWSSDDPAEVTIGAGSEVRGNIRFEHKGTLRVHYDASIGDVEGVEVERFGAERG